MTKIRKQKFEKWMCGARHHQTGCGYRWNIPMHWQEIMPGVYPTARWVHDISQRTQVTCDYPRFVRPDGTVSGTFLMTCPNCQGIECTDIGTHRGRSGKTACEQVCETATGGDCVCECGGANHGVRG